MTTVHVLGNPAAGAGQRRAVLDAVIGAIRGQGHDVVELTAANRATAGDCLHRVAEAGAERVVIVGGDGLAHLALQALAESDVILGVVPVGTGNDFARALGLPIDDVAAAVTRALAPAAALDALRTTHGWVASVATCGFSAAVNARANRLRYPRGGSRYTLATLLELPRLRALPLRMTIDDVTFERDVALLAIANTAYFGGGMAICPDARPADGRLELAMVDAVGRATLLRFFPQVFRGAHVTHPDVTMLAGRRVRIERTDGGTDVGLWGDGEPVGSLPIDIEVVQRTLRVAGTTDTEEVTR